MIKKIFNSFTGSQSKLSNKIKCLIEKYLYEEYNANFNEMEQHVKYLKQNYTRIFNGIDNKSVMFINGTFITDLHN